MQNEVSTTLGFMASFLRICIYSFACIDYVYRVSYGNKGEHNGAAQAESMRLSAQFPIAGDNTVPKQVGSLSY